MNTARFAPARRRFALTTASGLAISMMIAGPALAQDAEEGQDSEVADDGTYQGDIVVTGFKASLESAQNIKRDSDTFVDAVTAEDIGAARRKPVVRWMMQKTRANQLSFGLLRASLIGRGIVWSRLFRK